MKATVLPSKPTKAEVLEISSRLGIPAYTLSDELQRTAEMLVPMAETRGVYFVVAFLFDSGYDLERVKKLLPILEKTPGALKPNWKTAPPL